MRRGEWRGGSGPRFDLLGLPAVTPSLPHSHSHSGLFTPVQDTDPIPSKSAWNEDALMNDPTLIRFPSVEKALL